VRIERALTVQPVDKQPVRHCCGFDSHFITFTIVVTAAVKSLVKKDVTASYLVADAGSDVTIRNLLP
jgi:hypothetical protein